MTQLKLAHILNVSDKTISKWENSRGLPDISLIEPLSKALDISIVELMNGEHIINNNKISNVLKSKIYVCPICGNVIFSMGDSLVSCCGIVLMKCSADEKEDNHEINCDIVENEYYISLNHPMNKDHYISFIAYVTSDRFEIVKLYPEGNSSTRFLRRGRGVIYVYCNKHGLIKKIV